MIKLKTLIKEEASKEDVLQLQTELKSKYPQLDLLSLSLQSNGAIFIHNIRVKKEERKKGIGRKVMEEIKQFADKHGLVVTLSPESEPRYKAKLDKFYKDLGFSHNRGRKKDYRYSSFFGKTMIRRPLTEGVVVGSIGMDDMPEQKKEAVELEIKNKYPLYHVLKHSLIGSERTSRSAHGVLDKNKIA